MGLLGKMMLAKYPERSIGESFSQIQAGTTGMPLGIMALYSLCPILELHWHVEGHLSRGTWLGPFLKLCFGKAI